MVRLAVIVNGLRSRIVNVGVYSQRILRGRLRVVNILNGQGLSNSHSPLLRLDRVNFDRLSVRREDRVIISSSLVNAVRHDLRRVAN